MPECKKCGFKVQEDDFFCPECGNKLSHKSKDFSSDIKEKKISKNLYDHNHLFIKSKIFGGRYPYHVFSSGQFLFKIKVRYSFSRGFTYELHDGNGNFLGVVFKYVKGKFFSNIYNYDIIKDDKLIGRIKFETTLRSSGQIFDNKGKLIAKIKHEESGLAYFGKKFIPFSRHKLFFQDTFGNDLGWFKIKTGLFQKYWLHMEWDPNKELDRLLALAGVLLMGQALRRKESYDY